MKKFKYSKYLALMLCLALIFTASIQTTLAYVATKSETVKNTFLPQKVTQGDLVITKAVEHPFGAGYVIPGSIAFDFKVDMGAEYAGYTFETTGGEVKADENGSFVVTAKANGSVGIDGIDEGTKVIVTEIEKENDGFTVKDSPSQEATITPEGNADINFTNIYSPASVVPSAVSVEGTKVLEGREWQAGDEFTFVLEQKVDGQWKEISRASAGANDQTFDFNGAVGNMDFVEAGEYEFRITEVSGDEPNMEYDVKECLFNIIVADEDMDGELEIHNIESVENTEIEAGAGEGEYKLDVTFTNVFTAETVEPEDITVQIIVRKSVKNTGELEIGPEGFEFVLENVTDCTDASDDTQILKSTSDKDGNAPFDLTFTANDIGKTFTYKLTETKGNADGVTYSEQVYEIDVTVDVNDDNELVAIFKCDGAESEGSFTAGFENTYHMNKQDTPDEPDEPEKPENPEKPEKPEKPADDDEDKSDKPENPDDSRDESDDDSDDGSKDDGSKDDGTDDGDKPAKGEEPKTGDETNLILYILIAVQSMLAIILITVVRKKNI